VSSDFLTQLDLARRWRMSPRTLERWRWLGKGPPYIRIAHVLYRLDDVKAFEAAHIHPGKLVNSKSLGPVPTNSVVRCVRPTSQNVSTKALTNDG
jgi:hypothetical protein